MNSFKPCIYLVISSVLFACQNGKHSQQQTSQAIAVEKTEGDSDPRPKDEQYLLKKIAAESDYDITSNSVKKDAHIESFNKYAKDTLKEFKDWEFVVEQVNDNEFEANIISKALNLNSGPLYNLKLVTPIAIDNAVDTISISNRVDFTYTIPKAPKGDELKKQLTLIQTLNKGDKVIVSGALTHLNGNGKVDFSSFYDGNGPWNIDLLVKDIRKKESK